MEEEGALPIEEEEEPASEFVDGLELIFGRGKSGYKDVYPHRKGWQAKVAVEDKGVCSLGIFKDKRRAAIAVARAKARGLYLLHSPDKTRAKPGFGGAREPGPFTIAFSHVLLLDSRKCTVKRKLPSPAPAVLPIYYLASIENASVQIAPVPVQPLGSDACRKACMAGMPAVLAQLVVAPGPTQPTQQQQPGLLPGGGRLLGR